MHGAPAAILGHEVTFWLKAPSWMAEQTYRWNLLSWWSWNYYMNFEFFSKEETKFLLSKSLWLWVFRYRQTNLIQKVVLFIYICVCFNKGLPRWLSGKESACKAEDTGDMGLIPGSGRCPGGGHGNLLSILTWRIPWMEEPGRLQFIALQRVGHDWSYWACMHALIKRIIPSTTFHNLLL